MSVQKRDLTYIINAISIASIAHPSQHTIFNWTQILVEQKQLVTEAKNGERECMHAHVRLNCLQPLSYINDSCAINCHHHCKQLVSKQLKLEQGSVLLELLLPYMVVP